MSKKMKGTKMSLADFAGEVAKEQQLLPSESKGLERNDLPQPYQSANRGRPERRREEVDEDEPWRRGPALKTDDGEGAGQEVSRADEDSNWRKSARQPSQPSFESARSTGRVEEDNWRRAPSAPLQRAGERTEEPDNWRAAPRTEVRVETDERPAHLRSLKERLLAARSGGVEGAGVTAPSIAAPAVPVTPVAPAVSPAPAVAATQSWRRPAEPSPQSAQPSSSSAFASLRKKDETRQGILGRAESAETPVRSVGAYRPPGAAAAPVAAAPVAAAPVAAAPVAAVKKTAVSWAEEEELPAVDPEKLSGFADRLMTLLNEEGKKMEAFAKKAAENFTASEISSALVLKSALKQLVAVCRGKTLEWVLATVKRAASVLRVLDPEIANTQLSTVLVRLTQKYCGQISLPRLSPETALLEAIWLGFYEAELVPASDFLQWADAAEIDYLLDIDERKSGDDFGKRTALFQTLAFRQWLTEEQPIIEQTQNKSAVTWDDEDDDEEDVDAELQSFLSQTLSRKGNVGAIKKGVAVNAARR